MSKTIKLVDPQLNSIDDCLYRVAVRIVAMKDQKVLVVTEASYPGWWAFSGGGVEHGETFLEALQRELREELAVTAESITGPPTLLHYTIGAIMGGIPRMNLFFRVELSASPQTTPEISDLAWCDREEFLAIKLNESYDKFSLADIIFGGTE